MDQHSKIMKPSSRDHSVADLAMDDGKLILQLIYSQLSHGKHCQGGQCKAF